MGLYKAIKERLNLDTCKEVNEDSLRNLADWNGDFENLLVEYGIKNFIKKYKKEDICRAILAQYKAIEYLGEIKEGFTDLCGEDDEINVREADAALENALAVMKYLEHKYGEKDAKNLFK